MTSPALLSAHPARQRHPTVKLIAAIVYVVSVVLTPPSAFSSLALFLVAILALVALSRVDLRTILRRSWIVIPFVLLVVIAVPFLPGEPVVARWQLGPVALSISERGLWAAWNAFSKAWLSVLGLILLAQTTPQHELIGALRTLQLPKLLVLMISFLLRYLPLLAEEAVRMRRASDARLAARLSRREQLTLIGRLVGTLFIRTYERAERIHAAMAARGFTGEMPTGRRHPLRWTDLAFGMGSSALFVVIALWGGRL